MPRIESGEKNSIVGQVQEYYAKVAREGVGLIARTSEARASVDKRQSRLQLAQAHRRREHMASTPGGPGAATQRMEIRSRLIIQRRRGDDGAAMRSTARRMRGRAVDKGVLGRLRALTRKPHSPRDVAGVRSRRGGIGGRRAWLDG
jgi:hypothetical protein